MRHDYVGEPSKGYVCQRCHHVVEAGECEGGYQPLDGECPHIDCRECRHMIDYEDPSKWPDQCGHCGRSKEDLLRMEAEIFPGRVRISQHSDCPGLRDEFARSAMHAELSRLRRHGRANIEELADWAYQVADAMMRRREIDDEDDVRGE